MKQSEEKPNWNYEDSPTINLMLDTISKHPGLTELYNLFINKKCSKLQDHEVELYFAFHVITRHPSVQIFYEKEILQGTKKYTPDFTVIWGKKTYYFQMKTATYNVDYQRQIAGMDINSVEFIKHSFFITDSTEQLKSALKKGAKFIPEDKNQRNSFLYIVINNPTAVYDNVGIFQLLYETDSVPNIVQQFLSRQNIQFSGFFQEEGSWIDGIITLEFASYKSIDAISHLLFVNDLSKNINETNSNIGEIIRIDQRIDSKTIIEN